MSILMCLIDDGVTVNLKDDISLIHNYIIDENLEIKEYTTKNNLDYPSHGDICFQIIKKYTNDLKIISLKILSSECSCNIKKLCKAIKWCVDHNIRVINLSLGSIYYEDNLLISKMINYAYRNGVLIIAAFSNKNIFTFPASLNKAIGVKRSVEYNLEGNEFVYIKNATDGINFLTNGKHKINYSTRKYNIHSSNSYATPVISAIVYNILRENPEYRFNDVKTALIKKSKLTLVNNYNCKLEEYHDELNFPIVFLVGSISCLEISKFLKEFRNHKFNAVCIKVKNNNRKIFLPYYKEMTYGNLTLYDFKYINKLYLPDILFVNFDNIKILNNNSIKKDFVDLILINRTNYKIKLNKKYENLKVKFFTKIIANVKEIINILS